MPPRGPGKPGGKKPKGKKPKGKKPKGKKPKGKKPKPKGKKPKPKKPKPKKPKPWLGSAKLRLYFERPRRPGRPIFELPAPDARLVELLDVPAVANAIVWRRRTGAVEPYPTWEIWSKRELWAWCQAILDGHSGTAPYAGLPEAPPLKVTPTGADPAQTALSVHNAWQYFLAHVAQSLVADRWVPWSLVDYSSGELAMLFDSDSLFMWNASLQAYRIVFGAHGRATPGDPFRTYAFLEQNDLVGADTRSTIERVLDWCRANLTHYRTVDDGAAEYLQLWQYAGYPPVERMLRGTDGGGAQGQHFGHWTAGCWGTTAFLRAVLRTVNIPVRLDTAPGHALTTFVREGLHLSHGDDLYGGLAWATPPFPIGEILIDDATFQAWFGPAVPYAQQIANISRRQREVAVTYLPNAVLHAHCADVAAGRDHAQSQVLQSFAANYSVLDLEAVRLWERMDEKIASFGGCDHIPYGRG